MPALATGHFIHSFCLHYAITYSLGWIASVIQSLQNRVAAYLKIFYRLHILVAMFDDCLINTISSIAESREEQDGGK